MPTFYEILNVDETASLQEIKSAYRRLAIKTHPDTGGSNEKFVELHTAFETLSDPIKRAEYDNGCKEPSPEMKKIKIFLHSSLDDQYAQLPEIIQHYKQQLEATDDIVSLYFAWRFLKIIQNDVVIKQTQRQQLGLLLLMNKMNRSAYSSRKPQVDIKKTTNLENEKKIKELSELIDKFGEKFLNLTGQTADSVIITDFFEPEGPTENKASKEEEVENVTSESSNSELHEPQSDLGNIYQEIWKKITTEILHHNFNLHGGKGKKIKRQDYGDTTVGTKAISKSAYKTLKKAYQFSQKNDMTKSEMQIAAKSIYEHLKDKKTPTLEFLPFVRDKTTVELYKDILKDLEIFYQENSEEELSSSTTAFSGP